MNFGCKVTKKIATKFTQTYNKLAKKGKFNKKHTGISVEIALDIEWKQNILTNKPIFLR